MQQQPEEDQGCVGSLFVEGKVEYDVVAVYSTVN
jgi:hypothetical protein